MSRKQLSDAISGISMDYIAACEAYDPKLLSGKEQNMGKDKRISKRRFLSIALAACLVLALGITAFAADIPSYIADWVQHIYIQTPTDEIRESHPEYAAWLDEQLEIRATLEEMGEKSQQPNEAKKPKGLSDATITLLESCYDGVRFTMACKYEEPQWPVTFDFDENHPLFSNLEEVTKYEGVDEEIWTWDVPSEIDQELILQKLEENGQVGFTTYDFFISDHVLVNDEDPGFSHSEPRDNEERIFYVDPYYTSAFGPDLPESCQNLSELKVTFTVRCRKTHYWLEGDSVKSANGGCDDYPVNFVLPRSK